MSTEPQVQEPQTPVQEAMSAQDAPKREPKEDPVVMELRHKRNLLKGRLMTLQWDVDHGQINPGKKVLYEKLKKEFEEVEQKLK